MASVFFKRGVKSGLATAPLQDGAIYVTTDERAMYLDTYIKNAQNVDVLTRIRLGDFREYADFATIAQLSPTQLDTTALYYAARENILCKWTGNANAQNGGWIQVNPQSTFDQLVQDIYNTTSVVTGGIELNTGFRSHTDNSNILTGKVKITSADPDILKVSAQNNNGEPTIILTPEDIVYNMSLSVSQGNAQSNTMNLNLTYTKTGTDAQGNTVNDSHTTTLPIRGSGITLSESNGTLILTGSGGGASGIDSIANAFSAAGALTTTITLVDDQNIISTGITPTIQYGTNSTAVFASGTAVLDVYTKTEVDNQIASQLRAANAMTFKGGVGNVVGSVEALPTSNVRVGDTYKVTGPGTYGGHANCIVGDMLIATGTEDPDTGYITGTVSWVYIPSGNDDAANALTLQYNSTSGEIELVDGNSVVAGTIAAGTDIAFTNQSGTPVINHASVTRTNTTGAAQTQTSGRTLTFDVITGITTSATGHVTGVETTTVTVAAEANAIIDVTTSASIVTGGNARITIGVEDNGGVHSASFDLHSESLTFSASGSTTTVEMQWGSF